MSRISMTALRPRSSVGNTYSDFFCAGIVSPVPIHPSGQILPAEAAATAARPAEESLAARLQHDDIAQLQAAHDFAVHIVAQAEFGRNRLQAAVRLAHLDAC